MLFVVNFLMNLNVLNLTAQHGEKVQMGKVWIIHNEVVLFVYLENVIVFEKYYLTF